ncbi:MAG TPA: gamma-glutamyl-gamma-aminobutyrate hydrolase family protein [Acidimicrobiales bacterium]|nr:gamma-glutamyl-gamma-aminobutyrate hydrolase family protein [Acidimicrobiales bacterium]
MRPLIALPAGRMEAARIENWGPDAYLVAEPYVAALRRAGARPLILAGREADPPEEVLAPFDGLLLAGGGDVDPGRYATRSDERVYGIDADRDDLELALARHALDHGIPVLAICRGLQVVNVVCGGSLHQHLPDPLGRGSHGDPTTGVLVTHGVEVTPGSRLASAAGSHRLASCTSVHHQGVDQLGRGLVAVGWSDDGLVEALEPAGGHGWLVAVQWHPEITAADDPQQQVLFDAFVEAARARAASAAGVASS